MLRKITSRGFRSAIVQMSGQIINVILGIFIVKLLGPAEFGIYAFFYALLKIGMVVAEFGMPVLIIREIVRLREAKDWAWIKGFIVQAVLTILAISAVLSGSGFLYILLSDAETLSLAQQTMMVMLTTLPAIALMRLVCSALRSTERLVTGLFLELLMLPLLVVVGALIWTNLTDDINPVTIMTLQLLAIIAVGTAGWVILYRSLPSEIWKARAQMLGAPWLKSGMAFLLAGGASLLNTQIDVVILGFFRDPAEVGIYRAAAQAAFLAFFLAQVMYVVTIPKMARNIERDEPNELHSVFNKARWIGTAGAALVLLIYLAFGHSILRIVFGSEFVAGWLVLIVLCVGAVLKTAAGPLEALLSMGKQEHKMSQVLWLTVALNIILNIVLIPFFGVTGAASSTAVTALLIPLLLTPVARRTKLL